MRRDYGSVNPYLNTPPTKLPGMIRKEKDSTKKRQMQQALEAWKLTVPGPFRINTALDVLKLAHKVLGG
jgi:hypothetical protein